MPTVYLAGDPQADRLLAEDPLALLIGMLLDQQVPMEWAFSAPHRLAERLGLQRLDADTIAEYDPDALAQIFAQPPALHRFPQAMAERTQKLCRIVREQYNNDAGALWGGVRTGAQLVARLRALPGFGAQKAQIFTALLGKQFGVEPEGWREAAGPFGEEGSYRSVADIVDDESLARVRDYKKRAKAAANGGDAPSVPGREG
ncbi:MAG TPA: HhH-GPD-type base excision DNA repair protein [Micromonosporaceae bacterium]